MAAKTAPTDLIEWLDADPLMTAAEAEWWRTHAAVSGDEKQLCQRDMIGPGLRLNAQPPADASAGPPA